MLLENKTVLIFDWQHWVIFSEQAKFKKYFLIYTPNPAVYESIQHDNQFEVRDISELIDHQEAEQLGEQVFSISMLLKKQLDKGINYGLPEYEWGSILSRNIHHLLIGLCYHYFELSKLVEKTGEVAVPYFKDDLFASGELIASQVNYYGLLGILNIPINGVIFCPIEKQDRNDIEFMPGLVSDKGKTLSGLKAWILRFCARQNHFLGEMIRQLVEKYGSISLTSRREKFIWLLFQNSLLTQRLPSLLLSGFTIKAVRQFLYTKPYKGIQLDFLNDELPKKIISDMHVIFNNSELPKHYCHLLSVGVSYICGYLSRVLLPLIPEIETHYNQGSLQDFVPELQQNILLSNGFASPIECLAIEVLKKRFGFSLICFQHGGTGLLKHYRTLQRLSDMVGSDGYVCFSRYEEKYFRKHVETDKPVFYINGAWSDVYAPVSQVARRIVRKFWKIKSNQVVVLYAPTRFKLGHIWLPHGLRDMPYWKIMKSVVMSAMGGSNAQCIVKVHQKGMSSKSLKQLYAFRKSPFDVIKLPCNVRIENYPDLTYSRHAADIIIVDRATTTLGWALSSKAIVVYLNSSFFGLEDEVLPLMKAGLFVFDTDREGWETDLRHLIVMDINKRNQIWNKKKPERERFIENYVLGPKKSSMSFNEFLAGF